MKKHNYVYTIVRQTPNENGIRRGYIGVHCTDDLDDGYFGSGVYLKNAVKKYGKDDFVKTIVADFETEEEAVAYETELLHRMHRLSGGWELFSERFYNLRMNDNRGTVSSSPSTRKKQSDARIGRFGGVKHPMFGKHLSTEAKQKLRASNLGKKLSEETKQKIADAVRGRTHSEEAKQKIRESKFGAANPMFGKRGSSSGSFKGLTIGTHSIKGFVIVFDGEKSMKSRGFFSGSISETISGKYRHHRGFTFTRTKDPQVLQDLLDQDNFVDEESKNIIMNFLQND